MVKNYNLPLDEKTKEDTNESSIDRSIRESMLYLKI